MWSDEPLSNQDHRDEESPMLDASVRRRRKDSRRRQSSRRNAFYGELESQQYEQDESEVWWHHQLQRYFQDKGNWWSFSKKTESLKWLLTLVTGLCCAAVALVVTSSTQVLTHFKFRIFRHLIELEKEHVLPFGSAFAFLFCCNLLFGVIAWYTVYLAPMAAGSGIPEIKCYLNGIDIPQLLDMRTLWCKAAGIAFACAAGLPLGKEGPMVHIGAIIAAGISQGKSSSLGIEANFSNFQDLRNDREKRDFVACGSAAGVAAAFGAPIGGVLFSLEEGASFWSTKLTWRCFFCAMTTVFFLYLFNTAKSLFGHSDITAMFSFGEFFSLQQEQANYSVWELSLFVLVGYLGGLLGAFFNHCALCIFNYRRQFVQSPGRKCVEMMCIVSLMSFVSMALPLLWRKCTPLPANMDGWADEEKQLVSALMPLYCNGETHYNELASLYLADSDTAIRQLFHFREVGNHSDSTFSSAALFTYFSLYLGLACLVCNSATPAGLFVPSLLSGAAFGRLFGHLLHKLDNTRGTFADAGTYALMGAAALTAGITRMTISLTVMILEATGDMQYVLPLMLTVLTARLVGNLFTEGIYDMHIYHRQLAYLDEDDGFGPQVELHDLAVADIMTSEVVTLPSVATVGTVLDALGRGKHHCFPVVDEEEPGVLQGAIARRVLCTLLKLRAFSPADQSVRTSPLVNWGTLECLYPAYPEVEDARVTDAERGHWLDLRPYLDAAPFLVAQQASVQRAYRMFRTLGLRQLVVVNKRHQVAGIVTRSDLVALHSLSHGAHPAAQRPKSTRARRRRRADEEAMGSVVEMATLREDEAPITPVKRPASPSPSLSSTLAASTPRREGLRRHSLTHTVSLHIEDALLGGGEAATSGGSSGGTESDASECRTDDGNSGGEEEFVHL